MRLLAEHFVESVSLAVHELATNAVKFGAPSAENGRIRVTCDAQTDGEGTKMLYLEWLESGLDEPPEPGHERFGHEMLRRALPYELRAETNIEFANDGLRFTMSMPMGPDVIAERHT